MSMNEYSLADIAAATGNGGNGNGGFGDGNGAWWLLVLFALLGGFGNNGWGGQGGYPMMHGAGMAGGDALYPWINQSQQVNDGFRDQMIMSGIQGISQGVQGLSTQLCGCCGDMQMAIAGVNQGMSSGFYQAEIGANNRAMAQMGRDFDGQVANMQGFNGIQAQLADCCCENRLATANQTATILAENCADRAALSDGVRDIIQSNTANTQSILDKLCQLELDGYKRQVADEQRANAELRSQLTQARFDASQQAQNAFIQNGFANEVDALYNRLSNCPVPSMPVYGRTPIFTCQPQNQGCGCGCGCGNM